jgi:hypothetical protein
MTQTINGTNGNDTINGTNKGDTIYAKGGNDTVNGGNGNDFIDAGSGNDTVNAGNGDDEVYGGTGNDTIDGGNGDDLIDGDSGDDILKGGAGCDLICGGDGNDTITGGTGNDLINGGAGTDTAIFAGTYASYDILNILGLVLINGQDGTDLVLDVEYLKFDNGTYNVATHGFTPNSPPPPPLVSVIATDGVGTEAVDGTDFTYTFKRTGDLSQALTVNYSIMPAPVNGATPGVDLQPVTGTITFAAGSNTAVLQFNAIDDAIVENTELFSVVVGVGAGYQVDIPNATAAGSITDNDFTPAVVSLTPATVTTTEGGALSFTFTRAGGNLGAALTINYVVNDGGPAGGATRADGDFSYASGMQQITFAAGQTSASITVQTSEDTKFEGTESFAVALAGGVNYTANPASSGSTGVILDNDPAPLVSVVATDGVGTETIDGTDFTFTFSRTGNTSSALTVNYSVFPAPVDGATPGADFPAQTGTITFAAGSSTAVLQFSAIDDAIIENTELFSVVVGVGTGYQVDFPNATAGASILDNDFTPAVVSLTPATVETTEGGSVSFTFTRSGGNLAAPLTINYTINDGAPLGGATRADGDFSYASGIQQLTFAAGQTTATITVATNDDSTVEGDESFSAFLNGGLNYTVDGAHSGSTATIHDNDVFAPAIVSLTPATVETTEGGSLAFTFARSGGNLAAALTINYVVNDGGPLGGATRADGDFSYASGMQQLTFAAGQTTATITVATNDDAHVETDESFAVLLAGGVNYTADPLNNGSTGVIHDNDVAPLVSLTPATVETTEGGSLAFTFTRSGGNLAAPLTINYVVNDGGPLGGATRADGDFSYPSGMQQLTFAAGQTVATITVATNDDAHVETDESFAVLLAGGVDYTADPVNNGSTAVIHDNDVVANPLVSVVATDGVGTETVDGTDFTFTFSRTGSTAAALTVSYTIQPAATDGATPGADFPAQTGTITFAAGSATAVLSFDAIHDAVVENTEFFSVVVGAGAGYDVDTPNATVNASIADGTIIGTNAPETLTGTNDPDAILGLGGDDGLVGGLGADYLDGGAGLDRTIYTTAGAAVNIQLAAGTATIGAVVDTLRSIEFARGTAFGDVYNATGFGPASTPNGSSEGNNLNGFEGLGGNDQITGNGNTRAEYTSATAGVTVTFTTGNGGNVVGDTSVATDTLINIFSVRGSQFDDLFINFGTTNNTFDGQGGFDTVSYASAGAAVNVDLQTGNASGGGGNDVLRDNTGAVTIESAIGTGFNDTFLASGNNRFDGGFGSDTLNLNNAVNNTVTAISIETINGGAGNDTVTFVLNDGSVNQSINGGGGTNTLNLAGSSTSYSVTLNNFALVNGHGGTINDNLNVLNQVAGTTFDFGDGNADELHVAGATGINLFTVNNIENVFGALSTPDQIHIGGNSGGTTTVTAGGGPDQIWASSDADHFRFIMTGDSSFDVPLAGQRDQIHDFDAGEDAFVFDHIAGLNPTNFNWTEINFGGADIVLVDIDGGGANVSGTYVGYEMAIELQNQTGTLTNANFLLVV